jgi:prepilin-type N-terminal cleavage/methylation domain-containing protein
MKRGLSRYTRAQDGFTVIELMITLLILSILVGMVVMTMAVSRSKTQRAACKSNLRIINDAVIQYRSNHEGEAPLSLDALTDDPPYIKSSFSWMCPSGDIGTTANSGDYRTYYNSTTGETSCPRADHNF